MKSILFRSISMICFLLFSLPLLQAQEGVKYNGHSQDKYSHTLQFNFYADFRQAIHEHSASKINYSVLNYKNANTWWNLIPSYEFGYKHKWFFKFQTSCYAFSGDNGSSLTFFEVNSRYHLLNLYVSYNFLPTYSRHSLKLGIGPGLQIAIGRDRFLQTDNSGQIYIIENKTDFFSFTLGTELAYQWNFYKYLSAGVQMGYIFANIGQTGLYGGSRFTLGISLSATLSHK